MGKNPDGGMSDFWISDQSLIKKNCHNPRTSNDICMKLGTVTKIDKRNKIPSKKFSGDVIVIFAIYGKFGAIQKSNSGCMVNKTYVFINSKLLP